MIDRLWTGGLTLNTYRLHTISPSIGLDKIQNFVGVDCRTTVRIDHPAFDRRYC